MVVSGMSEKVLVVKTLLIRMREVAGLEDPTKILFQERKMFRLQFIFVKQYNHTAFKVEALADYYGDLRSTNEKRLAQADFIGLTVIPAFSFIFIACYWIIGILKYNQII